MWRWVSTTMVVLLTMTVAYLAFIGYAGSAIAVSAAGASPGCQTPLSAHGWAYEAINYPAADDAARAGQDACPERTADAGNAIVTSDGIRIAAWYVPAASEIGPSGPTVILAHDYRGNKSDMLPWAAALHDRYNLVLFDFRAHGQSSGDASTLGAREQADLRAVVDWVEANRAPAHLAVLGLSMGGAAAAGEAAGDPRVEALILDSTHATLADAIQARLARRGFPLGLPAAWAIMLGGLIRTGDDMSAADPVQSVEAYGDRPLLIIGGGRDDAIGSGALESLRSAAAAGGASVAVETCPTARHDEAVSDCAADYRSWVLAFLDGAMIPSP